MSTQTKILITFLIIVVGLLATSTGYLYAQNANLNKDTSSEDKSKVSTPVVSVEPTLSPTPVTTVSTGDKIAPTPTPTPTVSASVKLSGEKYTVKSGDTMSSIATKYGISWIKLAEANGLNEDTANNIKVGQVLVIPSK